MPNSKHFKSVLPYGPIPNETKKDQIRKMFNRIAPRYDLLNRILSLGIDLYWRRCVAKKALKLQPRLILDAATGTGDFIIILKKMIPNAKIIGIDIAERMLSLAEKKLAPYSFSNIEFQIADVESLPFPNDFFDVITVGFGVRNFENLEKGLTELHRVLRKKGKLFILEPGIPKNPIIKYPFLLYFRYLLPFIGKLLSHDPFAYKYLFDSVQNFPQEEEFCYLCQQIGFQNAYFFPLTFGTCVLYELTK